MKKIFTFFLAGILLFSLSDCAKTPDEALIAQKDKDRLASAAAETAAKEDSLKTQKEHMPEQYTFHYESEDHSLNINADIPITLPKTNQIPTYRATAGYLSQELVTRIYDYLFPDGKTYIFSGTDRTKSAIETEILDYKQMLAEVEASDDISEENKQDSIQDIQSIIASLEKKYEEAPETSTLEKIQVDSTLKKNEDLGKDFEGSMCAAGDYYLECETEDGSTFGAYSYPISDVTSSNIYYSHNASPISYNGTLDSGIGNNQTAVTQEQAIKEGSEIGFDFEDARKMAEQFFETVGIESCLQQIYMVKGAVEKTSEAKQNKYLDSGSYFDFSEYYESNYSAYHFTFNRVIEDVEITGIRINTYFSSTNYALIWKPETIDMVISPNGIEQLKWEGPLEIGEKMSDNVGLLSFEKASSIFEKMISAIYLGRLEQNDYQYVYNVDVTDIKLCLMPIRDNGKEKSGLLIPVWVFYGDWLVKYKNDSGNGELYDYTRPYVLMAVNAIDGTVIDPFEGY